MVKKIYQYWSILSLDVAVGASIMAVFACIVLEQPIPVNAVFALAISIWITYTIDHLWDARRLKNVHATLRHSFHSLYFKPILLIVMLSVVLLLWLMLNLLPNILLAGSIILFAVIIYFSILRIAQNKIFRLREIFIGLIYTTAVLSPAFAWDCPDDFASVLILYIQILLLAIMNLLALSYLEIEPDKMQGQQSYVLNRGVKRTKIHLFVCFGIFSTTVLVGFIVLPFLAQACLLLMGMGVVYGMTSKKDAINFRYIIDGIFCIPLIYILFSQIFSLSFQL